MEAYTLFELNEHIRRVVALNFKESIWVRCEIAQIKSSRGHYYLDLVEKVTDKDEILAKVNAVIWSKTAWFLQKKLSNTFRDVLQDGMEVRLKVRVDFHERFGLKLIIEDVDPEFTLGNIEARRRQIIETLQSQGMIGMNRRIPMPVILQRIAVLSAEHAAGFHDFRKHLLHNPWKYRFFTDLYPIAVQGALVESQLLDALEAVERVRHHYDCVVIIRGGGSRTDLAAFDSLKIGQAIAQCTLPVFTGIGHEIDHTVADAVAHHTLKTPTAVADFILEVNAIYDTRIHELYQQITGIVASRMSEQNAALSHVTALLKQAPRQALLHHRMRLEQVLPNLANRSKHVLQLQRENLAHQNALLESLDPSSVLQRGFSITTRNGKRLREASGVSDGDQLVTYLYKGILKSTVES